jgi:hypothetical protein
MIGSRHSFLRLVSALAAISLALAAAANDSGENPHEETLQLDQAEGNTGNDTGIRTESGYKTVLTASMATFYVIDADGRSKREPAPAVDVYSYPNGYATKPVALIDESARRQSGRREHRSTNSYRQVDIRRSDRIAARIAAFRCERGGFYYTQDGRCVQPAWGWRINPGQKNRDAVEP